MSDLMAWISLGMRHILDVRGLDHVLFLAALAAIFRPSDWRTVAWVITSFTVGHSITLALAVTGVVTLPGALIEFLIPVTIIATCVENLRYARRQRIAPSNPSSRDAWRRPVLAGAFGLVHGAGFANYLRALFIDRVALPLLGFNVGIELGQIVALGVIGLALLLLDRVFMLRPAPDGIRSWTGVRRRAVAVSVLIGAVASYWAVDRLPR
jgi:hypothetical protein